MSDDKCRTCGGTGRLATCWDDGPLIASRCMDAVGCGLVDASGMGEWWDGYYRDCAMGDVLYAVEHMTPDELREAQRCGLVGEA